MKPRKKSNQMTSLQEFVRQRKIRNKRMATRKSMLGKDRKGYSIVEIEGLHLTTFQVCIYLRNCDNLYDAEMNAKIAIQAIREKCGKIV